MLVRHAGLGKCGCEKAAVYELLRTGMVGGPAQVFTRYHEEDITHIRSHVYGKKSKLTKAVIGFVQLPLFIRINRISFYFFQLFGISFDAFINLC